VGSSWEEMLQRGGVIADDNLKCHLARNGTPHR
jgi:hypothetical protein